ncbi:MAG: response regulator transcription factor [Kineosporiaceae bacterium]
MSRGRVLVVEDERAIADLLRAYLADGGFEVRTCSDGGSALGQVAAFRPDVVLLDVGLPGLDGVEVMRRLRADGDGTPVVFVTARDDEVDRVLGLELGADDYVTKPFSPRELLARVRAVLRRTADDTATRPAGSPPVTVGTLVVDPDARRVSVAGRPVQLTTTEFDLLLHLARREGRVCARDSLLTEVWGYPPGLVTRTVDVHVAQLRAKLEGAVTIRAVRGVGYGLEATTPSAAPAASGGPSTAS